MTFSKAVSISILVASFAVFTGQRSEVAAAGGDTIAKFDPTPQNIEWRDAVVRANIKFTLFHEAFHLLVWAYDLPVLGREEDAADQFATYHLTRLALSTAIDGSTRAQPGGITLSEMLARADRIAANRDDISRKMAASLVDIEGPAAFLSLLGASRPDGLGAIDWWDEHGIDEQRAARLKCLSFGAVYERLPGLAAVWKIPEQKRLACIRDAAKSKQALDTLLAPWFTNPDTINEVLPPDSPLAMPPGKRGTGILKSPALSARIVSDGDVTNTPTITVTRDSYELDALNRVLEKYKPSPKLAGSKITIRYKYCGKSNAFFDPKDQTITVCAELLEHYRVAAELLIAAQTDTK